MYKIIKIFLILMISMTPNITKAQVTNMIEPVSYFVNHVRPLNMVKDNLNEYREASLVGISGIGKTQIARMYAHEHKSNYDIIWFIDCNLDINEEFLKLAKALNKDSNSAIILEDATTVKKEVLTYLTSKKKWLLMFDNLKLKTNDKVKEFIDWEHNGHVVFCSQDSELMPQIIRINSFNKIDTEVLINNIMAKPDQELAEFLMEEFKGYPVLIVQGVQLINHIPGLSKNEYKKKIHQSKDKINLNIKLAINELSPSSRILLNRIALINNQAFSKEFLQIITESRDTLDDDLYQLSKFALITNIDLSNNPVFEMHDIVANEVMEINGKNNKRLLEKIISKVVSSTPKDVIQAYIFRSGKTIQENLEIILKNSEDYNIDISYSLGLRKLLLANYLESRDYYNISQQIKWFKRNDSREKFRLLLMNNNDKAMYANYLGCVGTYYTLISNYNEALRFFLRAQEILNNLEDFQDIKFSIIFRISMSYIAIGQLENAINNIIKLENIDIKNLGVKSIVERIHLAKATLLYNKGDYFSALNEINKSIELFMQSGINKNSLVLTSPYILRVEILNAMTRYNDAYAQAKIIYDINKLSKKDNHEIFGRIFTQMSRAELGIGRNKQALEYAEKAIKIFVNDTSRPNQNIATSYDTELAKAFFAQGDALSAIKQYKQAIKSYLNAELLYWNTYKDNISNIDEVSRLYLSAVKCCCHLENKKMYMRFHDQHIRYFGSNHPRSIEILKMDSICNPQV